MVRLIFASLASKRQKEQTKWQIQKLCRSFSPLLRVHFCWQSSECVNLLLLEFPKTVRKCWLVERLDLLPMAVLLTFHADCSLVVLKPAHSSCLLPVASPFFLVNRLKVRPNQPEGSECGLKVRPGTGD